MESFFSSIDWDAIQDLALWVLIGLSYFLLYRSVPRDVFEQFQEAVRDIVKTTVTPIDDIIVEPILDIVEDVLVEEGDSTDADA